MHEENMTWNQRAKVTVTWAVGRIERVKSGYTDM